MGESDLETNKNLRLIAKSSIVVLIGVALSKVLMYIYRIVIARQFGPEIYGLFSLALVVVGLFVAVASFGLSDGILRYIPIFRGKKQYSRVRYVFGFAKGLLLVPSLIAGVLLFVFADSIAVGLFNNSGLSIFLKIFSVVIPLQIYSNVFLSVLRGLEKIGWHSFIINFFQNFLKALTLVVFVFFLGFGSSESVIYSYLIGILGMVVLSYVVSRYYVSLLSKKDGLEQDEKRRVVRDLFVYSWPLIFMAIMSKVFTWADTFFIGLFRSAEEVGVYNAAVPIAILLLFVTDLFMRLFFPLINREYSKKNFESIKELSKQVSKWAFMLNLPVLILVLMFPEAIINLLFGSQYLGAGNALRILAVGNFFIAVVSTVSYHLIAMTGRSKTILYNMMIFGVLNIALNVILVPRFGITGAAFATTTSYLFLSLLYMSQTRKILSFIPLRRKMFRVLIVGIVSGGALYFVRQFVSGSYLNLGLLGLFFVLLYSFLIIFTRSLDKNDIMVLRSIRRKFLSGAN